MGALAGIYAAPEAAATWAATRQLRQQGWLAGTERVVLFCTGMGLKYAPPPLEEPAAQEKGAGGVWRSGEPHATSARAV
jgi:threonine synthase